MGPVKSVNRLGLVQEHLGFHPGVGRLAARLVEQDHQDHPFQVVQVQLVLALDQDELDLDDLKWVVLMVLFNQPGSEAAYAWMETQMFLDEPEPVH